MPWLLFGVAAFVRVTYLLAARPGFESQQWNIATELLERRSFTLDGVRAAFEPVYPLFLAAARLVVGDRASAVQIVQAIVASLGAVFLYRLAATVSGRERVGAMAAAIYAVYPLLIRHSADPTDAALTTVALIAGAAAFVHADAASGLLMSGVWFGLATATRFMVLPLIPIAAAIAWRRMREDAAGEARARGYREACAFAFGALAIIAPVALRTYVVSGSAIPSRSGVNLFISNCDYTAAIFPEHGPDILENYAMAAVAPRIPPDVAARDSEREYDKAWTALAFEHMRRHPWRSARLKLANVWYFFSPRLVPYHLITPASTITLLGDGRYVTEGTPPRSRSDQLVYTLTYTPVLALAIAGLWIRRRRFTSADALLGAIVLTFVAAHALYFPTTRYRAPIEFVLIGYAATALEAASRALAARRGDRG